MPVFAHKGGSWKLGSPFVRKTAAWKAGAVSAHVSSAWKGSAAVMTVSIDDPSPYATSTLSPVVTGDVTATPSGGTAPYTYAWTFDSSDPGVSASNPTFATTQFGADMDGGENRSAIARCIVTDADGNTAFALCSIYLERTFL
jgi:hypothetical protein